MATDASQIKLLTIGDSGVGKSWLLLRWAGETAKLTKASAAMPTIGIDFKMRTVMVDGQRIKVQVWDTAGQERFRTITTSYYRNSQGILLVYDVTDRNSFTSIRQWIAQIQLHADVNINKILVGNKCDLIQQRAVSYEEGEQLAREFKLKFFETSAVNDINVDDAFTHLIRDVHQRIRTGSTGPSTTPSNLYGTGGNSTYSGGAYATAAKPVGVAINAGAPPPEKKRGWC